MKRLLPPRVLCLTFAIILISNLLTLSKPALAATTGGACPSSAQYLNPSTNNLVTLSSIGVTSCFYVAADGSDSNNGTSEQSAWLHAPGMGGCSGVCAATTPAPGQGFILRGGDTWGASTMPWTWTWAGSSSSPIYLGVDNTWSAGSTWSRPVLDCQQSCSRQFSFGESGNFVQLDNFELTGIRSTSSPSYGGVYAINTHDISGTLGSSTHVKVSNNYMHGACLASDGPQQAVYILGYPIGDKLSEEYLNVIDGSDNQFYSGGSCISVPSGYNEMCGICGGVGNIYQNFIGNLSNGIVIAGTANVHDNIITNINTSIDNGPAGGGDDHENAFESNGDCGTLLYNNQVYNNQFSGLVLFQLDPSSGCSDYAFNNILWNNNAPNGMQCYESGGGGSCYFFNNTAACGPTGNLSNACGRATGNDHGYYENNHFITSGGTIMGSSVTMTSNVTQSSGTASGQGYTSSENFVYAPSSSSGSTVGAGANVYSTFCSSVAGVNAAAGAACLGDTSYACSYSESSHSMTCPARTANGRPQSGAWDAGAYEFAAATTVAAPTGLTAVVQ